MKEVERMMGKNGVRRVKKEQGVSIYIILSLLLLSTISPYTPLSLFLSFSIHLRAYMRDPGEERSMFPQARSVCRPGPRILPTQNAL